MCNAWNHPPDCCCGWGGDGHVGGFGAYSGYGGGGGGGGGGSTFRTTFEGQFFEFPFVTYPSFVNPNARCPVCGADVYFYQSPYGGRVFFDDLGPPWPKHPCTDNPIVRQQFSTAEGRARFLIVTKTESDEADAKTQESGESEAVKASISATSPRVLQWVADGWMPFIVSRIITRRIGIEVEGKLFISANGEHSLFQISQSLVDARFYRTQGQLRIGFSLIQNSNLVINVLNECPILLKKNPDMENLLLSSFLLTDEGAVEEIILDVDGQFIDNSSGS